MHYQSKQKDRCNIVSPASDKHENTDCVIIPGDIVVNVYNIE